MKAVVNRTLRITSPTQLSTILVKEELTSAAIFKCFCVIFGDYLKGCRCPSDLNYSLSNLEYNRLCHEDEAKKILQDKIKCIVEFAEYRDDN